MKLKISNSIIPILCCTFLVLMAPTLVSSTQPPRVIHVFVALCDNDSQGIVPVSKTLGNGDDPANNLYWGALYGVKTHFVKSADWKLVSADKDPRDGVLERVVFRHKSGGAYMVAEAYRGREIRKAVEEFLYAAAGRLDLVVKIKDGDKTVSLPAGSGADLVAYVGHNGLMDFSLPSYPKSKDKKKRDAIILACMSKQYFSDALKKAGANPLLWTTGLMAPEAYTLEAALAGWIAKETGQQINKRAAAAYNKYQKCGTRAAERLLVTGF